MIRNVKPFAATIVKTIRPSVPSPFGDGEDISNRKRRAPGSNKLQTFAQKGQMSVPIIAISANKSEYGYLSCREADVAVALISPARRRGRVFIPSYILIILFEPRPRKQPGQPSSSFRLLRPVHHLGFFISDIPEVE
jgi:hypothetical protein